MKEQTYLVLSVEKVDYISKKTGNKVQFATVTYTDNGHTDDGRSLGLQIITVEAKFGIFKHLEQVPGFYEIQFENRLNFRREPETTIADLSFVSSVAIVSDDTGEVADLAPVAMLGAAK